MEKVIQFLVDDLEKAYEVIDTLKELETNADLSIAETFVLEKDDPGNVELRDIKGVVANNAIFGSFAGAMMGLVAGPFGFLYGASFGALFGAGADLRDKEFQKKYLKKVAEEIPNGKSMVISHIFEEWTTPIDTKLGSIAKISRINIDEEIDKAIQKDIDEFNKEIEETDAIINAGVAKDKDKLQQKLNDLKAKRASRESQRHAKLQSQREAYKSWFSKAKERIKSKGGK